MYNNAGLLDVELTQFDKSLRRLLERVTHSSIQDSSWLQATLPIRDGGLSLQEASVSSAAAFIGSCNTSRVLTQSFLQQANESLTTTDENLLVNGLIVRVKHVFISSNNLGMGV